MTLGGFICVRHGHTLDYSWQIAAESLLKVCDQLVLCDSDSTDGTREAMDRMADHDSRIKVVNWPWPNPQRESHHWFIKWLNFARSHLGTDFCLYLDADEVLSDAPECHAAIREAMEARKCLAVDRLNFWRDAASLIPDGHCCGKWCVRFGPQQYECVSDEPHHQGESKIVDEAVREPRIQIFHLGFLRDTAAFYRKARVVLGAWFGRFDPRLEAGEKEGKPVAQTECEFTNKLVPFEGYMPEAVERWLSDRGHTTQHYLGMNEQEAYKRVHVTGEAPPAGEPMNILIVGDLGDIIHGMAIFKAIGKVRLFARDANHICKRLVHRMPLIEPLLRAQDYIVDFQEHTDQPIHWNAGDFRSNHDITRSLAWAHLQHYRGQKGLPPIQPKLREPWIAPSKGDQRAHNRIVINRTNRYNNRHFRWKEIVAHYGAMLLFVGSQEEHASFCSQFGTVEYAKTENLLEVAELIEASLMFIGNQSACFAIAEGKKHRRLLEVCPWQPDVIIEPPGDPWVSYSADGALDIPDYTAPRGGSELVLALSPALHCPPAITNVDYLKNPNTQPRTGWRLGIYQDVTYAALKRQIIRKMGLSDAAAHKAIYDALAEREPAHFGGGQQMKELAKFNEAIANAHENS